MRLTTSLIICYPGVLLAHYHFVSPCQLFPATTSPWSGYLQKACKALKIRKLNIINKLTRCYYALLIVFFASFRSSQVTRGFFGRAQAKKKRMFHRICCLAAIGQLLFLGSSYAYVENIHDLENLKDTELLEIFNNPYGDPAKIPGEDRPGEACVHAT